VKDKKINIKIEGQLETKVESQNPTLNHTENPKSGGNTPSDLGAIKKTQSPSSLSDASSRSNLESPSNSVNSQMPSNAGVTTSVNRQNNILGKRQRSSERKTKKQLETNNSGNARTANQNKLNPILNQNRMKNFGKDKKATNPKLNPSASFLEGGKGLFNGKGFFNNAARLGKSSGLLSRISKSRTKKESNLFNKVIHKKAEFNIFAIFQALPIQIKIMIIGGGALFFLVFIVIFLIIAAETSAADGNREMKSYYLQGNYTEEQLCEYLERNNYLTVNEQENIKCEDTPAYQFFVNFKDLMEEYEIKYERYRFQVNVELLYETLAYYHSDEEMYNRVTKEEVQKLIDAMLEEIEESCVVKTYDKKKKVCTEKKYVYTLYEFSLNKYISYLKYGDTSTHPNYGHDAENKSSNGKSVERICGEGKNVDYVFGFGLVNTSSSPLSEGSNCPNNPVQEEDYENLKATKTTLEKLNAWGGVPKYSHVYEAN